jgi:hypothetical protein
VKEEEKKTPDERKDTNVNKSQTKADEEKKLAKDGSEVDPAKGSRLGNVDKFYRDPNQPGV